MSYRGLFALITVLLAFPCLVFAQNGNDIEAQQVATKYFYIQPDTTSATYATASLPFDRIFVSDARPDTSIMGYLYPIKSGDVAKICSRLSTGKLISSFLKNHLEPNFTQPADTIFAYLKNIWISNKEIGSANCILSLKIEFYLKNQSCFYPLYRFDSSVSMTGIPEKIAGTLLTSGLVASARKLNKTVQLDFQHLQCLSAHQIDSFNFPLRYLPVLRDRIIRKGIYLNFKQFLNNKPAYSDFKIASDEKSDILFVKGKVVESPWGFSDGEKIFIRKANNFFLLHRTGDSFEFFYYDNKSEDTEEVQRDPIPLKTEPIAAAVEIGVSRLMNKSRSKSRGPQLFQLNLETGRVYKSLDRP